MSVQQKFIIKKYIYDIIDLLLIEIDGKFSWFWLMFCYSGGRHETDPYESGSDPLIDQVKSLFCSDL